MIKVASFQNLTSQTKFYRPKAARIAGDSLFLGGFCFFLLIDCGCLVAQQVKISILLTNLTATRAHAACHCCPAPATALGSLLYFTHSTPSQGNLCA